MKTLEQIEKKLAGIESDERLHYKAADIFTNAPLALIQVNLEAVANTLRWVLDLPPKKHYGKD